MRTGPLAALALGIAAALPAAADTVYLTNGNSFEGVIAEVTDAQVRIVMPGGQLSLPRSAVVRVEAGEAPWAEYLAREKALRRDPKATAHEWLELARWAKARGLNQGVRDAALRAAEIDPDAEGLEPLLRGVGYVYDRELERWIPYADSMRRRGFVLAHGVWISRAEHEARLRAAERQEQERRQRVAEAIERARSARTDRLLDIAEVQLTRDLLRRPEPTAVLVPAGWGWPLLVVPGVFPPPGQPGGMPGGGGPAPMPEPDPRFPPRSGHGGRLLHQPGSLIPGDFAPISTTGREP
jgi:hypothetical protein